MPPQGFGDVVGEMEMKQRMEEFEGLQCSFIVFEFETWNLNELEYCEIEDDLGTLNCGTVTEHHNTCILYDPPHQAHA